MKFQFCGNLTIPEWFLSQLNLLSKFSALKLRKLGSNFVSSIIDQENSTEIVKKKFLKKAGKFRKHFNRSRIYSYRSQDNNCYV